MSVRRGCCARGGATVRLLYNTSENLQMWQKGPEEWDTLGPEFLITAITQLFQALLFPHTFSLSGLFFYTRTLTFLRGLLINVLCHYSTSISFYLHGPSLVAFLFVTYVNLEKTSNVPIVFVAVPKRHMAVIQHTAGVLEDWRSSTGLGDGSPLFQRGSATLRKGLIFYWENMQAISLYQSQTAGSFFFLCFFFLQST